MTVHSCSASSTATHQSALGEEVSMMFDSARATGVPPLQGRRVSRALLPIAATVVLLLRDGVADAQSTWVFESPDTIPGGSSVSLAVDSAGSPHIVHGAAPLLRYTRK